MTLLNLNLHRKFFCAVLDGSKKVEYRARTDFWEKRLTGKEFTHVRFRNGYLKTAPEQAGRSRGGLGLGLALVKLLVGLHGGEVWAASEGPGCGSEFTVRLPQERTAAPPVPSAPAPAAARSCRILVIEDNRDAANMMKMLLGLTGHQAEVAYSGPAGVETALQFPNRLMVA